MFLGSAGGKGSWWTKWEAYTFVVLPSGNLCKCLKQVQKLYLKAILEITVTDGMEVGLTAGKMRCYTSEWHVYVLTRGRARHGCWICAAPRKQGSVVITVLSSCFPQVSRLWFHVHFPLLSQFYSALVPFISES